MEENITLKTKISGLDDIFYKGIKLKVNKQGEVKSLVIALIGPRGVHKPLLAMQMLQGITDSIRHLEDRNLLKTETDPRFYSINKPEDQLENMYEKMKALKKPAIDVQFNRHEGDPKENDSTRGDSGIDNRNFNFSNPPIQQLNDIMNDMEKVGNEEGKAPCMVLDGITQLAINDLRDLNFTHLERVFRRNAYVSILVFNQSGEEVLTTCNADIIIEMDRVEEKKFKYMYHQLRVLKCLYQPVAYGWHQYKKRDYGIEVYCSPHLILHRSNHIKDALDIAKSNVWVKHEGDIRSELQMFQAGNRNILERVLLDPSDHLKVGGTVTAIIGPANSHKRFLAMGYAFCTCCQRTATIDPEIFKDKAKAKEKQDQNTLIILLDKEESKMIDKMICPALLLKREEKTETGSLYEGDQVVDSCKKCYTHLHTFELRMGCIGTDEFIYHLKNILQDAEDSKRPIRRIIVDDLQKVEYSFPFFYNDKLFLTAFISLCRDKGIDLLFLCDESAEMVKELQALADNVIHTGRLSNRKNDHIQLTVEKYSGIDLFGEVYSYDKIHPMELYRCSDHGIHLIDKYN